VYDLNAFSSSERPSNLKIIVINNGGGDIFRLIDGPSTQPERETFFATPRTIDLQALAKGWGLTSYLATDALSLQQGLTQLRKSTECCVLEVQTEPLTNQSVYKAYQQLIKSNA
jgi:2-succinyl-5-enolpyruvyl-6-hydroxy-3-cyclohexene-1-carboxylate synthase